MIKIPVKKKYYMFYTCIFFKISETGEKAEFLSEEFYQTWSWSPHSDPLSMCGAYALW